MFTPLDGLIGDTINTIFCEIAYGVNEREELAALSLSTWNINGTTATKPDPLNLAAWNGHRIAAKGLNINRVIAAMQRLKTQGAGSLWAGTIFRDPVTGGPVQAAVPVRTDNAIGRKQTWQEMQAFLSEVRILSEATDLFSYTLTLRQRTSGELQYPIDRMDWGPSETAALQTQWTEALAATPEYPVVASPLGAALCWVNELLGYVFSGPTPIAERRRCRIVDQLLLELTVPSDKRAAGMHWAIYGYHPSVITVSAWDIQLDTESVQLPFTPLADVAVKYYIDRSVPGPATTEYVAELATAPPATVPFVYNTTSLLFGMQAEFLTGNYSTPAGMQDVKSRFLMDLSDSLVYV